MAAVLEVFISAVSTAASVTPVSEHTHSFTLNRPIFPELPPVWLVSKSEVLGVVVCLTEWLAVVVIIFLPEVLYAYFMRDCNIFVTWYMLQGQLSSLPGMDPASIKNVMVRTWILCVTVRTDIVMILNEIFVYVFPETGWIWTKLGRAVGLRKEWAYKIFEGIAPRGSGERGKILFFCEEYHVSFWSLLLYRFSRNVWIVARMNHFLANFSVF